MTDPYLTEADTVVLRNLFQDIQTKSEGATHVAGENRKDATTEQGQHDLEAIARLKDWNDPSSEDFRPTVFVTWDDKDIHPTLNEWLVRPYAKIAAGIVRHPTDVVFFTHILLYLFVNLPSAIWLFYNFTYIHGVLHVAFGFWCTGSFTLMMHNHIHNNGVLSKDWAWLDLTFPYILEPLFGHTWDSYYYHHVKHHHVEGNGPEDLSSTIRYQRDDLLNFLHYWARFFFFIWLDLPLYFIRKNKPKMAAKAFFSEAASLGFMYYMTAYVNSRAATFTLLIPFILLRLGLMVGNWGQHALVDEIEPDSDFRSSITLIDVPSNRFCFNDGYHTAHHLNPRRHWRDQPLHFLQSKEAYSEGRALVFHNIDYLMMTVKLLQKDYMHLAKCLVPIGDQIGMTQQEIADMLRTKTRRFTEKEIQAKFKQAPKPVAEKKRRRSSLQDVLSKAASKIPDALAPLNPPRVEAEVVRKSQ